MNDAQLMIALGRAKAQLKARQQTELIEIYIQRAEILEACYAEIQELANSHRWYAKEIIEYVNKKEVSQ